MGRRQENILKYINPGYEFSSIVIPNLEDYKASPYYKEIFAIYRELGGIQSEIPVGIKSKDLDVVINRKLLELDEENHFNRYRLLTLKASIYNANKAFNTERYKRYCQEHESKCQMRGGYWTSPSSEKQFGISNTPGDFKGNGSARLKQRAFYDMLKDFIPHISGNPIRRIAIYDHVNIDGRELTIHKILNDYKQEYKVAFSSIIEDYVRPGNQTKD